MALERQKSIDRLNALFASAESDAALALLLRPYLFSSDYLVRSKAWAFLVRRPLPPLREELVGFLKGGENREWELRALAALEAMADPGTAPGIAPLLFQWQRPLLIRGALWVLVQLGGAEAEGAVADFLLHPNRRFLKDGYLSAALKRMLEADETALRWQKRLSTNVELRSLHQKLLRAKEQKNRSGVYPFRDYLLLMAKRQGWDGDVFRRAMYYRPS